MSSSVRSTKGQLGDMLGALAFVALATTLVKDRGTAREISAAGNAFTSSIRAAQGLPPRPTVDEQLSLFTDRWLRDPDADLTELEARLDDQLGIKPPAPPAKPVTGWHRTAVVSDVIAAARDAGVRIRRGDILDR